jgi:hypothetical protein
MLVSTSEAVKHAMSREEPWCGGPKNSGFARVQSYDTQMLTPPAPRRPEHRPRRAAQPDADIMRYAFTMKNGV